jgi:bla regulator protein blaR1
MTGWILETFVATTLLMLLVLLMRKPVASRFGPRAAYLLWLAPALRMIMPPLPAGWMVLPDQNVQNVVVIMTGSSSPATATLGQSDSIDAWPVLLITLWLVGAAFFFARHIIAYRQFVRLTLQDARSIPRNEAIDIQASPAVTSPLALGIIGKTIVVPHDFTMRFNATEQRLALAHELTHHRRGDPTINLAALIMLALHWFNPIAHIAHRAFRLDQEAACDAIVLDGATMVERHAYGTALFKAATGAVPLTVCAMAKRTTLKARLRHIVANPQSSMTLRIGSMVAGILVITAVLVTASNRVSAADLTSTTSEPRITVYRGKIVEGKPGDMGKIFADAKARAEKSDAAIETAERAAEAASDAADKASDDAESDVEHANADVARAKADLARANADLARASAEAARRIAEQAAQSLELPEPPEPPTPPSGEAPPAPASPKTSAIKDECPKSTKRQVIRSVQRGDDGAPNNMDIVICYPNVGEIRESALRAMKAARLTIANQAMLSEAERANALASLDREIRAFADRHQPR